MGLFTNTYKENAKTELERATRKIEEEAKKQEMAEREFKQMVVALDNNVTFAEMLNLITEDEAYRYTNRTKEAVQEFERCEERNIENMVDENHMTMVEAQRRISEDRERQNEQQVCREFNEQAKRDVQEQKEKDEELERGYN